MQSIDIKAISPEATYSVRQPVLRPGKHLTSCQFENDHHPLARHFGALLNEEVIGVASIFLKARPGFVEHHSYQVRAMGVLPDYHRFGLGARLLMACIEYAKSQEAKIIWCNAREIAVPFYQKQGFHIQGEKFMIPDVGPHFLMLKFITR